MAKSILSQMLASSPAVKYPLEIDKLFDSLMEFGNDVNKACKYVRVEERKNKKMLDQNFDRIGKVITCHLVLEHFINRELKLIHKIDDKGLKEEKYKFYEKIKMLPQNGMIYSQLLNGILEVNSERNRFAHNLNYEIQLKHISEVSKWIRAIPGVKVKELSSTEKIEKFTQLCIFFFSLRSEISMKQFKMLAEKYPNVEIFKMLIESSNKK